MAIIDLNKAYTKIRNKVGNPRVRQLTEGSRADTKQKDFGIYTSDQLARESSTDKFDQFIGVENPLHASLQESDGFISDQNEHVYEFINKFKVADVAVGSIGNLHSYSLSNSIWGQWREFNPAGIKVSPLVFLFPAEKVFTFGYSHEYGNAWQGLSSSGPYSKIVGAAEALRTISALAGKEVTEVGGKFVPKYINAPTYTSSKPLKLSSSIKFEFKFGQAGIFSAEEEVVRPILALASLFAPFTESSNSNYVNGPAPTKPTFLANFLSRGGMAIKDLLDASNNGEIDPNTPSDGESKTLIQRVTEMENQIINTQVQSIKDTLGKNSRGLYIRMGRLSWGPAVVGSIDWNFDFEQVDEYGFPYQGDITFGGLESPVLPTPEQFSRLFDGGGIN